MLPFTSSTKSSTKTLMSLSSLDLPPYGINPSTLLFTYKASPQPPYLTPKSTPTFESALAKRLPPRVSATVVVSTLTGRNQWVTLTQYT